VAVTLVADMGDLTRFESPRERMKCMGLIPSEPSSGEQRRQGSIPKRATPTPDAAWVKGPGPIALPPRSVVTYNYGSKNNPKSSRTSVGKRR
jgi:transposase